KNNISHQLVGNESGLAGYWRFDERFGTTTADLSGNNHTGLLGGTSSASPSTPAWTNGLDGFNLITISGGSPGIPISLGGSDLESDPLTSAVTQIPLRGRLYQTPDGTTFGPLITNTPAPVSNPQFQGIYSPVRGISAVELVAHSLSDPFRSSGEAITILDISADPSADTDGDTMPDVYEVAHGLNPEFDDGALDLDHDGLTNLREFQIGTRPDLADTDGDGLSDGLEVDGKL